MFNNLYDGDSVVGLPYIEWSSKGSQLIISGNKLSAAWDITKASRILLQMLHLESRSPI